MLKHDKNKQKAAINSFVIAKAATPTQIEIYKFMVNEFNCGRTIQNSNIREKTKQGRGTTLHHLNSMIEKKMVRRYGKIYYAPILPK